jgi:hypothetical protein
MEIINRHELLKPQRRRYTDLVYSIGDKYGFTGMVSQGGGGAAAASSHAAAAAAPVDDAATAERKARTEAIAAKYGKGKDGTAAANGWAVGQVNT